MGKMASLTTDSSARRTQSRCEGAAIAHRGRSLQMLPLILLILLLQQQLSIAAPIDAATPPAERSVVLGGSDRSQQLRVSMLSARALLLQALHLAGATGSGRSTRRDATKWDTRIQSRAWSPLPDVSWKCLRNQAFDVSTGVGTSPGPARLVNYTRYRQSLTLSRSDSE